MPECHLDEDDEAFLTVSVGSEGNKNRLRQLLTNSCSAAARTLKREDQEGCISTGQLSGSNTEESELL